MSENASRAAPAGVFDDVQAATLLTSDREHWWFRSKASVVGDLIDRHVAPSARDGWLVDIGAGAGGVTRLLGWPLTTTLAVEGSTGLVLDGCARHGMVAAAAGVDQVPIATGTARVVTMLDVIEHLREPGVALAEADRILGPGGLLVVTVPGHQWLWSGADEALGHVKRYRRRTLAGELDHAGFEVLSCSHVFSWLVPPVLATRKFSTRTDQQLGLGVSGPKFDRAARVLTGAEMALTRWVSLPVGTSVAAVARKSG